MEDQSGVMFAHSCCQATHSEGQQDWAGPTLLQRRNEIAASRSNDTPNKLHKRCQLPMLDRLSGQPALLLKALNDNCRVHGTTQGPGVHARTQGSCSLKAAAAASLKPAAATPLKAAAAVSQRRRMCLWVRPTSPQSSPGRQAAAAPLD